MCVHCGDSEGCLNWLIDWLVFNTNFSSRDSYKFKLKCNAYLKWYWQKSQISCWNPTHGEVYSIQHYVIKFVSDLWRGVLDTTLCDKVCPWLAAGLWFSLVTPVSFINTTDHHDITEILLKMALNTITPSPHTHTHTHKVIPQQFWDPVFVHLSLQNYFQMKTFSSLFPKIIEI